MAHRDGRVILSAWVESDTRDLARIAAKAAGMEFSRWVESVLFRAMTTRPVGGRPRRRKAK